MLLAHSVSADEIRPAFLELSQQDETSYKVLWKRPIQGEAQQALKLEPLFPESSRLKGIKQISQTANATLESYVIEDDEALIGKTIKIIGLEATSSDVFVRILYLDGETEFIRVLPEKPSFTVAHTITLMLASLDMIHLSSRAVEATIALSIIFVAAEVVYAMRGREHLTIKYPWLIAFGFGLIHGLGFAEEQKEIGLPQNEIVPSLIFFNIGVELGQLLFIFAVLLFAWIFKSLIKKHHYIYKIGLTYSIGIIATFWFFERALGLLGFGLKFTA